MGERVSRVPRGCDLKLTVLEQCAYTTTLGLTHLFHDQARSGPGLATLLSYPDVRVRVYCDARLAQAQHWPSDRPEPFGRDPLQAERELEHRWVLQQHVKQVAGILPGAGPLAAILSDPGQACPHGRRTLGSAGFAYAVLQLDRQALQEPRGAGASGCAGRHARPEPVPQSCRTEEGTRRCPGRNPPAARIA